MSDNTLTPLALQTLKQDIQSWSAELGFQQMGITDTDIRQHSDRLQQWLGKQFHGEMEYMESRQALRADPSGLVPKTLRVISFRMDYLPEDKGRPELLAQTDKAYISRYTLGRDYHKLIRKRLSVIADRIRQRGGEHCRAFVDSAPVLERGFAEKAGLGWIGKNAMLINARAGSWFFLGEIYTDLPLPIDEPQETLHCGTCTACLQDCPTGAIVAPFQVDARRCISYLTIELRSSIPEELRPLMGNRIFGCDDCQLVCPWNKFAEPSQEPDFQPRHGLDDAGLLDLFNWTQDEFDHYTKGSAIRRIGYDCWQRNLAVALGNATPDDAIIAALSQRLDSAPAMVREHIEWALNRLRTPAQGTNETRP